MKKIIINGNANGEENYKARKTFYQRNGWQVKDEDEFGCVVERTNRAGEITEIQLIIEDGCLYEEQL